MWSSCVCVRERESEGKRKRGRGRKGVGVHVCLGTFTLISHPTRSALLWRNDNNIHHLAVHLYRHYCVDVCAHTTLCAHVTHWAFVVEHFKNTKSSSRDIVSFILLASRCTFVGCAPFTSLVVFGEIANRGQSVFYLQGNDTWWGIRNVFRKYVAFEQLFALIGIRACSILLNCFTSCVCCRASPLYNHPIWDVSHSRIPSVSGMTHLLARSVESMSCRYEATPDSRNCCWWGKNSTDRQPDINNLQDERPCHHSNCLSPQQAAVFRPRGRLEWQQCWAPLNQCMPVLTEQNQIWMFLGRRFLESLKKDEAELLTGCNCDRAAQKAPARSPASWCSAKGMTQTLPWPYPPPFNLNKSESSSFESNELQPIRGQERWV